jgi:hypothetical protein
MYQRIRCCTSQSQFRAAGNIKNPAFCNATHQSLRTHGRTFVMTMLLDGRVKSSIKKRLEKRFTDQLLPTAVEQKQSNPK